MRRCHLLAAAPALSLVLSARAVGADAHAQEGHLGKVDFANSCDAKVQPELQRAVAMLHSFWYSAGEKAFRKVLADDPTCAIATCDPGFTDCDADAANGCEVTGDAGTGVLAYWPLDGSGAESIGGRDLDLVGGVGFAGGLFGQALDLHADASQYAQRPIDDQAFDFGAADFTVQAWLNLNSNAGEQNFVEEMVSVYKLRRDVAAELLDAVPGLSCSVPDGAFYLFPNCSGVIGKHKPDGSVIETDLDFVLYLLDNGVAAIQGSAYGLAPYFRISIATSLEAIKEACARIKTACAALR